MKTKMLKLGTIPMTKFMFEQLPWAKPTDVFGRVHWAQEMRGNPTPYYRWCLVGTDEGGHMVRRVVDDAVKYRNYNSVDLSLDPSEWVAVAAGGYSIRNDRWTICQHTITVPTAQGDMLLGLGGGKSDGRVPEAILTIKGQDRLAKVVESQAAEAAVLKAAWDEAMTLPQLIICDGEASMDSETNE